MSRPSLAVVLVVLGNLGVRADVRMAGFSSDASLDEVCDVLSAGSESRRRALRINALRALGKYIEKNFDDAKNAAEWLTILNRRLGVWAATSCAREALHLVPPAEHRPRIAVETVEAWVTGKATKKQARKAGNNAYDAFSAAGVAEKSAVWAARAAADSADSAFSAAMSAIAAAVMSASEAYGTPAWNRRRDAELRRLVTVISERLVLFPEWTGKPSDDRWPLITKRKR